MEVFSRSVVVAFADRAEAGEFAGQLAQAIRLAYVARGTVPPLLLLEVANRVSMAAGGSAGSARPHRSRAGSGTPEPAVLPDLPGSPQPVKLNIAEAARAAEVSSGYMRRICRNGDLGPRSRKIKSAWSVDSRELAAWCAARHREDNDRKAA